MGEVTNERSPLLPDRHPQRDLFVCDVVDAVPKGDMSSMEHPVFSLSTKPDMRPRRYERGGNWIEISPSRYGLATVHDRDVLIYCISQCMSALNEGRKVARTMRFKAYDLLVATNRQTSGRGYELLKDALRRLQGTQIETNLRKHQILLPARPRGRAAPDLPPEGAMATPPAAPAAQMLAGASVRLPAAPRPPDRARPSAPVHASPSGRGLP